MHNFAGRLVERLGRSSCLQDSATGEVVAAEDLAHAIAGYAGGFRAAGLRAGERILIGCDLHLASSLAYLGAMFAGLVPVPVHERVFETSGQAIYRRSGARAVWTPREARCDWAGGEGCLYLRGSVESIGSELRSATERNGDDLAALMPTSGTTGMPRLVRVTHDNLVANTEAIIRSQGLTSGDRAMLILPVSYCFGASVLHTHLYQGGGVVFDSRFMFPDKVLRAISQFACTTFAGVPSAYSILLRRSSIRSIPLPSLRRFLQAGGALPWDQVLETTRIAPHAEFYVMYGQTEATSRISCLPPSRIGDRPGSVGVPLDNVAVRVIDEGHLEVPVGQSGEIQVSGPSVCDGYFDDEAATAEKFHQGWLSTGDVGFRDADGFLWIVGRRSEFIKMRGVRVSLAEIESRIGAASGVLECAASAVPHAEAGEAVTLYVVADASAAELARDIRRAMPADWVCASVRVVTALPKSPNGKLVRSQLAGLIPLRVIE
jgi:acyl-CoA synthetase (AMP-forming)/AMP-acid ligase II